MLGLNEIEMASEKGYECMLELHEIDLACTTEDEYNNNGKNEEITPSMTPSTGQFNLSLDFLIEFITLISVTLLMNPKGFKRKPRRSQTN